MAKNAEDKRATACSGCGALLEPRDGPCHRYLIASPACWAKYGDVLAYEYSDPALLPTHRLTVDTYAVQHPGDCSRQAIQSVGLHLARLMIQLESPVPPRETNDVILHLGPRKATLRLLDRPDFFQMTIADVWPAAGTPDHARTVRLWSERTWRDWCQHHEYIRNWVSSNRGELGLE